MKKYAIFSAVIGNYDTIQQPQIIHEDFDYIIFSNSIEEDRIGIWKIRKFDYYNEDKTRIARWVKTHPEILVKEYDFSIWIDANIMVCSLDFYNRALQLFNSNTPISSMWHNERDCIFDEAATVAYGGLDSERIILDWEHFLLKEKYPQHQGLFETNVLYRDHNNDLIREFDKLWWLSIDNYSRRDQLSFNYVLWKLNINCPFFLNAGKNTRNSDCVKWNPHQTSSNRHLKVKLSDNQIVTYYKGLYSDRKKLSHIYQKVSPFACRHFLAFIIGQYYRFLIHLRILKVIK